jgi:hypothetical protein
VDREYGSKLLKLPENKPKWVVDSNINKPYIAKLWEIRIDTNYLTEVTSFHDNIESSQEEIAISQIETIDEHYGEHSHHPPFSSIRIIGAKITPELSKRLSLYGFNYKGGADFDLIFDQDNPI